MSTPGLEYDRLNCRRSQAIGVLVRRGGETGGGDEVCVLTVGEEGDGLPLLTGAGDTMGRYMGIGVRLGETRFWPLIATAKGTGCTICRSPTEGVV